MRNLLYTLFLLIWFTVCGGSLTLAQDFHVGQSVILEATKPIGVPLHRYPAPSYLKHIPTGTPATIEQTAQNGLWLFLRLPNNDKAWVHKKYLKAGSPEPGPPAKPEIPLTAEGGEQAVWASRDRCEAVVKQGSRMAAESSSKIRLATWNIRWFPIGKPSDQSENHADPTDIEWLICAIRWMQIDILAVQESLATPEATKAWDLIINSLNQRTGDTWRWYRQPCGRPDDHHVGLLWNDTRVSLSQFESLWQFNAKARSATQACTFGLRPGQYAWVQARKPKGVDFHLIGLHLKSGPTVFAVEDRHNALNQIDQAIAPLLTRDRDVIILGDFNTMGAGDRRSRDSELKYLRRKVAKEKPGFTDLALQPQCSHYFRGQGGWLDHVLVPQEMKEVTVSAVQVTGYCAVEGCERIRGDYPLAYRHLSDHCPVVLEIENIDND
ncbi:MAG TPA: endonuclease/exonuclease/phosphatase family protein [Nitrospirales bacterium]|nr:endonuclease/exonuclease/phosphatase family protein [Nitrospirales bacterium]